MRRGHGFLVRNQRMTVSPPRRVMRRAKEFLDRNQRMTVCWVALLRWMKGNRIPAEDDDAGESAYTIDFGNPDPHFQL
jgi:hypothetical protein